MRNNVENYEYLELKKLILDQTKLIKDLLFLIPKKISLSQISDTTGKSRQTIRDYLINNYEPEEDFWKIGGKIYVSRNIATDIIRIYNAKR